MRIAEYRVHRVPASHRGDWILLEIHDADGTVGWGEGSSSTDDDATASEIEAVMSALAADEHDLARVRDHLATAAPDDKPRRTAFSAIEHAFTDLAARRNGVSVAAMLAGKGASVMDSVPVYANVNRMCRDRAPDTVAAAGRAAMDGGLTRVKFAPFDEVSPERLAAEGTDIAMPGVERLAALRDAIGPDAELMLDCHWRFAPDTVPFLAEQTRALGIDWIEDPLPDFDPGVMQELRDLSGARIAGGEALLMVEDFEALAESGAVDVLIADVKFVGGVGTLDRICKLAAENGLAFAPHNPSGPVSTAASAHVVAANPNGLILEYAFGEVSWRQEFARGEALIGDRMAVAGPGFGIEIDWNAAGPRES
ncbi:MAG: mandelate racemase/muconate lactonizing enzyme family protein [Alphaproteobacteria bacterium]|nr:mandelate racemase/muconate lactonizing enzyme family protein [Alphaproteobacteria bacterium]